MKQIHHYCLEHLLWYKRWHMNPYHKHVHWLTFFVVALLSTSILISFIAPSPVSLPKFANAALVPFISSTTAAQPIAAGGFDTLAIQNDGTVWASGLNSNGQLGDGTITDRLTMVQVSGLSGVTAVAAGFYHSLALKSDGTVWAWGYNSNGQLGDGTITDRHTPVQVSGLSGVIAIAAGYYHSLALKSDGTVWAWGWNATGQLGDGTTTDRYTPVQVTALSGITAVAGGYYHSLALKSDGTVWAWGYNGYGELGDGTFTNRLTPVQATGLSGVTAIAAGAIHSLAHASSSYAWGSNALGPLGIGFLPSSIPFPFLVPGSSLYSSPTAGNANSYFIDGGSNAVIGAGDNTFGQLCNGTFGSSYNFTPATSVTTLASSIPSTVTSVSAGAYHLVVQFANGQIGACGFNGHGELSNNTTSTGQNTASTVVTSGGTSSVVCNPLPPNTFTFNTTVTGSVTPANSPVTVSVNGGPSSAATVSGNNWSAQVSLTGGYNTVTGTAGSNVCTSSTTVPGGPGPSPVTPPQSSQSTTQSPQPTPQPTATVDKTAIVISSGQQTCTSSATSTQSECQATPGDTITYTLDVKNTGNSIVQLASIFDQIASNATFVPNSLMYNGTSLTDNPTDNQVAKINNNTFTGNIGNLFPGQSDVFSYTVMVNQNATDSISSSPAKLSFVGYDTTQNSNNVNIPIKTPAKSVCGNAKVEQGEECDPPGSDCNDKNGQKSQCDNSCKCPESPEKKKKIEPIILPPPPPPPPPTQPAQPEYCDYPNAPAPYPSKKAQDAERHCFSKGKVWTAWLGETVTFETDGLDQDPADQPDLRGGLLRNPDGTLTVFVAANTAADPNSNFVLNVWDDVNGDGNFDDSGEWKVQNLPVGALNPGGYVQVPLNVKQEGPWLRVGLMPASESLAFNSGGRGEFSDGEVTDFPLPAKYNLTLKVTPIIPIVLQLLPVVTPEISAQLIPANGFQALGNALVNLPGDLLNFILNMFRQIGGGGQVANVPNNQPVPVEVTITPLPPTPPQQPPTPIPQKVSADHLFCYDTYPAVMVRAPLTAGPLVNLGDQFGQKEFNVPTWNHSEWCNPAQKTLQVPASTTTAVSQYPDHHYIVYPITRAKPGIEQAQAVIATDQFGTHNLTLGNPSQLFETATKLKITDNKGTNIPLAQVTPPQGSDLECYPTTDAKFTPRTVSVLDQFTNKFNAVRLTSVSKLCAPAIKTRLPLAKGNALPPLPQDGQHYLCYNVEQVPVSWRVTAKDQFSSNWSLLLNRTKELCVPANKQIPPLPGSPNQPQVINVDLQLANPPVQNVNVQLVPQQ